MGTRGTLVSLLFLHTLTDLMGFSSLLKAWSLALAGNPVQVAPFLGFRDDPMAGLYKLSHRRRICSLAGSCLDGD